MGENDRGFRSLLEEIRAGSEDAACELMTKYGPAVRRVVRRYLRERERLRRSCDSADFEQEVWASFFAKPPDPNKLDRPEALVGFLVSMANHKLADEARRQFLCQKRDLNRQNSLDGSAVWVRDELAGPDPTPSTAAAARERWEQLPERDRRILELLCDGRSRAEVAVELDVSEKTVQRVVRRFVWGEAP